MELKLGREVKLYLNFIETQEELEEWYGIDLADLDTEIFWVERVWSFRLFSDTLHK